MNMNKINTDRLIKTFQKIVSIDSTSFEERDIADFLLRQYHALGIKLSEDSSAQQTGGNCGNLHGMLEGTVDMPPLLFCAHMDTVEPSKNKQAIIHENGKITSDGTTVLGSDDAAALAVILEAVQVLQEKSIAHRPIELLFTTAEEPYCEGISHMDFSVLRAREAYVFDLSGAVGHAALQAPTILSFCVKFSGKSAHAGFAPEDGIHTIQAAVKALSEISNGRIGDTTVNVGTIHGGIQNNIVPDECTFTGEIRSYVDEHAQQQLEHIKSVSRRAAEQIGASVEVTYKRHVTAYCTPETASVVSRFRNACETLGLPCELQSTFGGSDNNYLALHGISGIVPATAMNQVHSCQEYTTITELENAAKLALQLMCDTEV